jgi:DNA-binding response OmpR family regulator
MKVLVLDDNHGDFLHILNVYGAREEVEFHGVATATEAKNLLLQEKFDALLLDGNLDDEGRVPTGPAVLRNWLLTELTVPLVFMISGDDALNAEGVKSGARGILGKLELWNIPRMLKQELSK